MLELKAVEVVLLPPLVLLSNVVEPEVVLLWLEAVFMLVVVELTSVMWEDDTVVDEIERDMS